MRVRRSRASRPLLARPAPNGTGEGPQRAQTGLKKAHESDWSSSFVPFVSPLLGLLWSVSFHWAKPLVRTAVAVLIFVLPRFSQAQVMGKVSDSSGLAIVGAEIAITCASDSSIVKTDLNGSFRYSKKTTAGCTISITQRGFETFQKTLASDEELLDVQLKIAALEQVVRVEGRADENPLLRTTISSVSLSDAELNRISNNTGDFIRYAKLLAGVVGEQDVIRVDGLPAYTLPPAEMIAGITVNANPFSAQYAEGNANFIDIVTKAPERKLRFNIGGSPPGAGARDSIMPSARSDSASGSFRLAGPVARLPLTFSLRTGFARNANSVPIVAAGRGDSTRVESRNRNNSGSFDLYYSDESMQASLSYSETRGDGSNQGSGGLTSPEAGYKTTSLVRSSRFNLSAPAGSVRIRSGAVVGQRVLQLQANSEEPGIFVPGALVGGGAAISRSRSNRTDWNWTSVLEPNAQKHPWLAGLAVARSGQRDNKLPNPWGIVEFDSMEEYQEALAGHGTGTWSVTKGDGVVQHHVMTAAPFVQGTLRSSARLQITGGLRLEYQSRFGSNLSPRVAFAAERTGIVFRGGAGYFVRNISNDIFMRVLSSAPAHLREYVSLNTLLSDVMRSTPETNVSVHSTFDSNLTRGREIMVKGSIEPHWRSWNPAVEYTWTRNRHLLGSRRITGDAGWLDIVGSNSLAERHEVHLRSSRNWRRVAVSGNYNWIQSRDTGDGPFSFPEDQNNIRAEWARTTGVSPHNVTAAAMFSLPARVSLSITQSYRSSSPFNVTTGLDPGGLALYVDRGARRRNSGNGPGQNLTSMYFSRRLTVPQWKGKLHMNAGLQVDNVLASKNYIGLGSVLASPLFGKPIAAYPGRSLRFWFNFD